jgi:cysteinyl-tRNA synthetase
MSVIAREKVERELEESGYWEFNSSQSSADMNIDECMALVAERSRAKQENDFQWADMIRMDLKFYGYTLEDRKDGTVRIRR